MKENKYDDNIFFSKIQSNESLAERTGWCGRMGDFEKDAT